MHHWYVVRSRPHRERAVCQQALAQGWDTFFPTAQLRSDKARSACERAYFPGYLFVRVDPETVGISRLRWLPAAIGLVEFGGVPATVSEAFVTRLKARIEAIRAAGGLWLDGLAHSDPVTIVAGPFKGYEAVFDLRLNDSDRVRILLKLLRRSVKVELDAGTIRKVSRAASGA